MPDSQDNRAAVFAGLGAYFLWGCMPGLFIFIYRAGASPWELLGQRALWAAPWAGLLVVLAGQQRQAAAVFARPRVFGLLCLSTLLIALNWGIYVKAVADNHNLEASLGYYINPLLNMAAGIVLFRERVDRWGVLAMALAAIGVLLQAVALGHPPWIALTLGLAFTAYGVIRKQVDADAQTGLFVECLLMAGPGLAYVVWLYHSGAGLFGHSVGGTLLISLAGPATVAPLALFAWSARRLPLSSLGFMQFIGPTMGFITGLAVGEPLGPLRALSFAFIWGGALTFAFGAWRAGRRLRVQPHSAA